ncbi:RluA family pseudouridine synthase [Silvibacterium sp.]|uniref:RluA family pseudouridine synthase n=1 Tax=Silvibacterium sp. TaxID=1964179 RepID=UPI0039E31AE4
MSTGSYTVPAEAAGQRLDAWLASQLENVSRARVQLLLGEGKVLVEGAAGKASQKLRGGETVAVLGPPEPPPLRATPEMIPLDIIYEDDDLSVINKPAGMMVHAGAGATHEDPALDERNRGTLVNALLGHYSQLSSTGGALRPGIVHRLDKQTSGLIIVARNDAAHLRLAEMFSSREVHKTYLALVHGDPKKDAGTINAAIGRDLIRRTRMTTKRSEGARAAISHYTVLERIATRFGKFALVSVKIETGRTHQIRVHMSSIGHPVVGDTLYGAPAVISAEPAKGKATTKKKSATQAETTQLDRNFLHAARLEFAHPRTNKILTLEAPLPAELTGFLDGIR